MNTEQAKNIIDEFIQYINDEQDNIKILNYAIINKYHQYQDNKDTTIITTDMLFNSFATFRDAKRYKCKTPHKLTIDFSISEKGTKYIASIIAYSKFDIAQILNTIYDSFNVKLENEHDRYLIGKELEKFQSLLDKYKNKDVTRCLYSQ